MGLYGLSTRLASVSTMQYDSTVSTVLCYIVHSVHRLLILITIMSAWEIIIAQVYAVHGHLPVSTNYKCTCEKDKCPCSKNIFPYCAKCTKKVPDISRNDPSEGVFRPVFSYSLEVISSFWRTSFSWNTSTPMLYYNHRKGRGFRIGSW